MTDELVDAPDRGVWRLGASDVLGGLKRRFLTAKRGWASISKNRGTTFLSLTARHGSPR